LKPQLASGVFFHLKMLGDNINTVKKNTEVAIIASKEVGLEVNT
jgi:hypothetical protein